ncbi:winged helix-turn-helix domain-containing protein [Halohasta salina]|uniref:winged helix-turn-helix domain-containing protein n=1 Tax=Halohasta salina TaxID=2961621 RepID=UPI0020A5D958|nr:winged helix-turn-helix domain-containing protein [Halohasta salina]
MTTDPDDETDGEADAESTDGPRVELQKTKARIEAEADRAVTEFDEGIVDLLAWLLDTETRARIYVYLRQHPHSTSDEVADGTGLYPSTVREALAELHDEGTVHREKRESSGAGNNPYEYEAIAPSELVRGVVGDVQRELNTVFTLDDRLGGDDEEGGPITISVDDEPVEVEVDDAEAAEDADDAAGDEDADGDDAHADDHE